MPTDQSVRTLMNNAGYDNSKIGFDPNSGYVTYDKQNFIKPQMNVNGTTYTDQGTFDQAHNQFKQQNPSVGANQQANNGTYSWMNSAEDHMDIPQRFAYYTSNPQAGQTEYNRAQTKANYLNSIGDTQGAAAAKQYMNQVGQTLGPQFQQQSQQSPQDKSVNDLIASIMQKVQSPQAFYPYSSPEYAAAKSQSDYGAKQAINSGLESLGTSGMARSSDAINLAQNTQDEANQRLLTQVVPQLIAAHNAQEQQKISNLSSILNPLMTQQQLADTRQQRTFDNNMATDKFNYQKATDQQKMDYQKYRDGIADEQYKQKFDEDARRYGIEYALKKAVDLGQLSISQQNANTSAASAANSNANAQERLAWDKNPNNPANVYKNAQAEDKNNPAPSKNDVESQYISGFESLTPAKRVEALKNEKANIVKDIGISGYNTLYGMYVDQNGEPK